MAPEAVKCDSNKCWWAPTIVACGCLAHLCTYPIINQSLGFFLRLWYYVVAFAILAILVHLKKVSLSPREFGLVSIGFILNWIQLSPSFFYAATEAQPKGRPNADQIVGVMGLGGVTVVLLWTIVAAILLKRRFWLAIIFGMIQIWFSLVGIFMLAGALTNAWL